MQRASPRDADQKEPHSLELLLFVSSVGRSCSSHLGVLCFVRGGMNTGELSVCVQAFQTGKGPVANWQEHVADPWNVNGFNYATKFFGLTL